MIHKVESNSFLYNLLSNPDSVLKPVTDKYKPKSFKPSDPKKLWYEVDVQMISIDGQCYGNLYLSEKYIMFDSLCDITP